MAIAPYNLQALANLGNKFGAIIDTIEDYIDKAEDRLVREHEEVVKDWDSAPWFDAKSEFRGDDLHIVVSPKGNEDAVLHWHWVSRGTKARPIYPTGHPSSLNYVAPQYNAKGQWIGGGKTVLRYTHTYLPHTSGKGPGFRHGGAGQYVGSRVEASSEPNYPGIAPRHFEEGIRSRSNLWFGPGLRDAIAKAAK